MLERSFSYETFDHHQNAAVLGSDDVTMPHSSSASTAQTHAEELLPAAAVEVKGELSPLENRSGGGQVRRKRRRTRSTGEKKGEEKEKQRIKHIDVERTRRRQMNDHLSVLKSLMPSSYAQRGDQASIVGGAINFLKELEQLLHSLEAQQSIKTQQSPYQNPNSSSLFSDFFIFPQFSTTAASTTPSSAYHCLDHPEQPSFAAVAEVEVTMVESHANVKFLTKFQSRHHLFKMVKELHSLGLSVLHLNLTTCKHMALYTLSVKVEEARRMSSVNEIASAVHELVRRIQEET